MTAKVLYEKRDEVAYITLNRPEVKNAIDIEAHELMCDMWRDFRDDPALRVAVITGTGDAFTAGADLKTHAPEWQTVGPMVGRERLEDGLCGITRGPLSRITKPIVAAINGWCVGHGVELAMACDIRIASERAQFGTFEVRRGMHPADGGIPRLVNTCGVGVALELLLTGEPISAERALTANMVSRVVPHDKLMEETDALPDPHDRFTNGPGRLHPTAMSSSWLLSGSRNTTVEYANGSSRSLIPVCSIPSSSSQAVHRSKSSRAATLNET
jgi:enoyl-CoA hydratase/carnithine racemase